MRPLRENERESRWRAFWHGLYWHFPLCCILAYLIRWNASSYNGIYTLHPDRTVKAWKPCWWHDSHPPKGSIRDSNWVGLNTYDRYGVVPEGAWPGEARPHPRMTREEIDEVVCEIMMKDGPDGHTDGHELIADFIMAVLEGNGEKWAAEYSPWVSLE